MRSLRKEVQVRLRRQGSVPIDNIRNRALRKIEQIQKITAPPRQKQRALEEAMMIYQGLQRVEVPERQDYNPHREVSLAGPSPYLHSGGLGYQTVSWKYMGASADPNKKPYYDQWFRSPAWRAKWGKPGLLEDSDYWMYKEATWNSPSNYSNRTYKSKVSGPSKPPTSTPRT
jgi:hypothetical protein